MAVMGSPHGSFVCAKNKLTMFGAHCPFIPLDQLAESKVKESAVIIIKTFKPLSADYLMIK
jgi:hypothetical protein